LVQATFWSSTAGPVPLKLSCARNGQLPPVHEVDANAETVPPVLTSFFG